MEARLTEEAELDLIEAIQWYDERDAELGNDLLRCIFRCIASIEKNPSLYPLVHRQVRRALVHRFPFQILYEIENEEIIVYAVITPLAIRKSGNDEARLNIQV